MLQICFGIYLVFALAATLLIWSAVVAANKHDMYEEYDRQHHYQIALNITNPQNTQYEKKQPSAN